MANPTGMTLNVSEDLVRPVIEAKIQAAIAAALSEGQEATIIERVVTSVLQMKVSNEGKRSSYDYENKVPYVQWLCEQAIKDAAKVAVKEWVTKNNERISKALQTSMAKQGSLMTAAFTDGLLKSIQSDWNFKVEMKFNSQEK